jgi:hypothetical protein
LIATGPDGNGAAVLGQVYGAEDYPCNEEDIDDECAANARLIAAAPDLLGRCIHLRNVLRLQPRPTLGGWNWPKMADDLDAVIVKATGQSAAETP